MQENVTLNLENIEYVVGIINSTDMGQSTGNLRLVLQKPKTTTQLILTLLFL